MRSVAFLGLAIIVYGTSRILVVNSFSPVFVRSRTLSSRFPHNNLDQIRRLFSEKEIINGGKNSKPAADQKPASLLMTKGASISDDSEDLKLKIKAVQYCINYHPTPPQSPDGDQIFQGYVKMFAGLDLENLLNLFLSLTSKALALRNPQAKLAAERYNSLPAFVKYISSLCRSNQDHMTPADSVDQHPHQDQEGLSAEEQFIRRGQQRSLSITTEEGTSQNPTPMQLPFEGREVAMRALLEHVVYTMENNFSTRDPFCLVHGSPGIGKTRLFQELAAMSIEQRCKLPDPSDAKNLWWVSAMKIPIERMPEEYRTTLEAVLPIHISFSGKTPAVEDAVHCGDDSMLDFGCLLRVIFTWLVDVPEQSYGAFVKEIVKERKGPNALKVKQLLFRVNIFNEIRVRSGGKQPFLLVDDPMQFEREHKKSINRICFRTQLIWLFDLQWGNCIDKASQIPIAFSTVKLEVFSEVRDRTDRPIHMVPLSLFTPNQGKHILESALSSSVGGDGDGRSLLDLLCQATKKPPGDVLNALNLLAGGHARSFEIIVQTVRACLLRDKNCNLNDIIHAAAIEFASQSEFDSAVGASEAVLLALYNRKVLFYSKFTATSARGEESEIDAEDLMTSGLLMGRAELDAEIPKLPLLPLLGWSLWNNENKAAAEEVGRGGRGGGKDAVAAEHSQHSFAITASDAIAAITSHARNRPPHSKAFESMFAYCTKLTRIVHREISLRGRSLPLAKDSFIGWNSASVDDMFPAYLVKPQLSAAVKDARFDLTQPLEMVGFNKEGPGSLPSLGLSDIDAMSDEEFDELTSTIYMPSDSEAAAVGIDHFLVLKDVSTVEKEEGKRRVVVLAVANFETPVTAANVTVQVKKARKLLWHEEEEDVEKSSQGRITLLLVSAAWRNLDTEEVIEPADLPQNCIVMSMKELVRVFGKPIVDFVTLLELTR